MRTRRIFVGLLVASWSLAAGGIASAAVVSHTVSSGESLTVIAEQAGLVDAAGQPDWRRLCDANDSVKTPNLIFVGQELRVPDASETVVPRDACELPAPLPTAVVRESSTSQTTTKQAVTASQQTASPKPSSTGTSGGIWADLRGCESNGYGDKRNSLYRGAYQFSYSTWQSVGGSGDPADAPSQEQDQRAATLQARDGWGAWPTCSVMLGLG